MIDKFSLYEIWAPSSLPWSGWAKPVLFAYWPREVPELGPVPWRDVSWAPAASEKAAILVEMPGVEAVATGLALAELGYCPVPVFTAAPPPTEPRHPRAPAPKPRVLVDVDSILSALVRAADALGNIKVAPSAPPAFLIDESRSTSIRPLDGDHYDNRSWIYTTDFPSAERMRLEGIERLIVATTSRGSLATDLEHVLRVWAKGGLALERQILDQPRSRLPLRLRDPSWITGLRLWLTARLRAHPVKGHGHHVGPSSG